MRVGIASWVGFPALSSRKQGMFSRAISRSLFCGGDEVTTNLENNDFFFDLEATARLC
jgi:hypothetical protein